MPPTIIKITENSDLDELQGEDYQNNIVTAELYGHVGFKHKPNLNTEGVTTNIGNGNSNKIIIATKNRNIEILLDPGETVIYSVSNDEIKASIKLDLNNNIIMNNGTDSAVRFFDLDLAFNELKIDFNNLVAYLSILTLPVSGAVAGPPLIPPNASTADIANAEIQEIKVP